jgi:DNA-binding LacI/PurR family transcriptional regulator
VHNSHRRVVRSRAAAARRGPGRDYYALIVDAAGDPGRQRTLAGQLRDQQVDGLILSPVDPSDHELEDATGVAREVLTTPERPTAAFCLCDSIAYGVYAAARGLGMKIPTDLSVIGYDNHPISALLTPALTSFDWDPDRLVKIAGDMVRAAIEGKPRRRRHVMIEPTICLRDSTARMDR